MKLQKNDFCNWNKGNFSDSLSLGLSKLIDGLRYDSLSTYCYIFDRGIDDPIRQIKNTDLSNLLDYKNGQDCYDILFELLRSIPPELSPEIVGAPNTVHTSPEQLAKTPYLHVAMTIIDPRDGVRYLLEPGKWVNVPIALTEGAKSEAISGDTLTVVSVNENNFKVIEHKKIPNRNDEIIYEWVPIDFNLHENYIGYMRIKERYNCITSVIKKGEPTFYMKYLFEQDAFKARLPEGETILNGKDILSNHKYLDCVFSEGVSSKALRFMSIFKKLPIEFWL